MNSGKEGLLKLEDSIKRIEDNFKGPEVKREDIELLEEDCYFVIFYSSGIFRDNYSSKWAAQSAAEELFSEYCTSPEAFFPPVKECILRYQTNKLQPYYLTDATEKSVYTSYTRAVEETLQGIYAEAMEISVGELELPKNWAEFQVYPQKLDGLRDFAENRKLYTWITEGVWERDYDDFGRYKDRMSYEHIDEYIGDGLFGRMKYKREWYIGAVDFGKAGDRFRDNVKHVLIRRRNNITNLAMESVQCAVADYKERVIEEIHKKKEEFHQAVLKGNIK